MAQEERSVDAAGAMPAAMSVDAAADAAAGAMPTAEPMPAARSGSAGDADPAATPAPVQLDGGDASLLALIDRLAGLLERSDLEEIEVESGATALVLRKPSAVHSPVLVAAPPGAGATGPSTLPAGGGDAPHPAHTTPAVDRRAVVAPLTGIYYAAPSPGSAPYVKVGSEVAVGQVIGLIEAMKLFNEIKSDVAGRVARIPAENGQLIKAKQPIIEVEPL